MGKNISKKYILFFLGCIFIFFPVFVYASDEYSAFSANAYLRQNGELFVKEEFIFDFGNKEKHGLFRNIPLIIENEKNWFEIKSISVKNKNNEPYIFESNDSGNVARIKIGDPNITLTGTHYYNLEYSLTNVGQTDQAIWKIIGKIREPILKFQANLYLPKPIKEVDASASCSYNRDEVKMECTVFPILKSGYLIGYTLYLENITNEEIIFSIKYMEGLVFPSTLEKNNVLVLNKKSVLLISSLLLISILFYILLKYKNNFKKSFKKKVIVSADLYSYIAKAVAYRNNIDEDDIIANLIDLSERGYVSLEQIAQEVGLNEFIDYSVQVISDDLPSEGEAYLLKSLGNYTPSLRQWLNNSFEDHKNILIDLAKKEVGDVYIEVTSEKLPRLIGFKKITF